MLQVNKEGKSIINIDGPPARTLGEDVGGLYELWNTDGKDVNSLDSVDRANSEVILSPPAGGTKFRVFSNQSSSGGVSAELIEEATAAEAFEKMGAAHHRVDTTRHPAMHKTETVDYIILLKGEVTLILDEEEVALKPFDVVVHKEEQIMLGQITNEPALDSSFNR